jgi:hypothetical protein
MAIIEVIDDSGFGGWYWKVCNKLHGPFRSQIEAARDAWRAFPGLLMVIIR